MSKRPANRQVTAINDLLDKILAGKGLDKKLRQYRTWTIWDDVVGPQIARHAQPLRIRDSILEVRVENATWMQQLQLLKPKILKELNENLDGETLTDIFWKRGKVEREVEEVTVDHDLPELTKSQKEEIDDLTAEIRDIDLQQRLKKLLSLAGRHEQSIDKD